MEFRWLYAYTAVDIHTRQAQVMLLPGLTSQDGRKALELARAYFGSCEVLQTDGGGEFRGEFYQRRRWVVTLGAIVSVRP